MTYLPDETTALYLYGIAPSLSTDGKPMEITARGLDGAMVSLVVCRDVGVLVHSCPPFPYEGDVALVHAWVLAQHEIISAAHAQAGTVLPIRFNSIVAATGDRTATEVLVAWLDRSHDEIVARLDGLRDHVELGVRVTAGAPNRDPAVVADVAAPARGRAYFQEQLAQRKEKERLRATEAIIARTVFDDLAALCGGIVVNPKRPPRAGMPVAEAAEAGGRMLLDIALLAHVDKVAEIGRYLGDVTANRGLSVRFTGPWAPYAFVGALDMPLLVDPQVSEPTMNQGEYGDD
jgi:hypothetical protein